MEKYHIGYNVYSMSHKDAVWGLSLREELVS